MLITMPTTAPRSDAPGARQMPPCAQARGLAGLGCSGNCGQCPAAQPHGGMGAIWDGWPAPFNNPLVLAALVIGALLIFGGGFKLFGGKSSGRRNAKLRLIRAKAEEERARLLAS